MRSYKVTFTCVGSAHQRSMLVELENSSDYAAIRQKINAVLQETESDVRCDRIIWAVDTKFI